MLLLLTSLLRNQNVNLMINYPISYNNILIGKIQNKRSSLWSRGLVNTRSQVHELGKVICDVRKGILS